MIPENIAKNAQSLFRRIPLFMSPSEILRDRVAQLKALLKHENKDQNVHYELLRYYPLACLVT